MRKSNCILLAILLGAIICIKVTFKSISENFQLHSFNHPNSRHRNFPTNRCEIPLYDPWNSAAKLYYKKLPPINCSKASLNLVVMDENGFLILNKRSWSRMKCFYQEIIRNRSQSSIFEFQKTPIKRLFKKVKPHSDFVYVECRNQFNFVIYVEYFAHVQKLRNIRKYEDGELDLILIGLDSMSSLNFQRQFPKTHSYIKTMKGIDLKKMFKVGVNTFPNIMALLTGLPPSAGPHEFFESNKFLWDGFKERGAVTMYSEDQPTINMFYLHGKGLNNKPTDHYAYTFWQAVESSRDHYYSTKHCLNSKIKFSIHLNYLKSFLRVYKDHPKFLFSLYNELTHDYLNVPSEADEELEEMLRTSLEEGLLKRSVLVIFGDHGHRIDAYRMTDMGRIEDQMPYTSIILPQGERNKWYATLSRNREVMVSTYDLYRTFLDVLSTLNPTHMTYKRNRYMNSSSLFRPMPARSCLAAGIPEENCPCIDLYQATNPSKARFTAQLSIEHVNKLLKRRTSLCAEMKVDIILKSRSADMVNYTRMLTLFQVSPSEGIFESIVDIYKNGQNKIIGDVLRINRYGEQAACLSEELQKIELFKTSCFCSQNRSMEILANE